MNHPVLLFDGECNFCRACVKWTAEHDVGGTIYYAAMQSPTGSRLLEENGLPPDYSNSVALIDDQGVHLRSDAMARLFHYLGGRWRALSRLRAIPRPIRDFGYNLISKNRPAVSTAVGTQHRRYEPPPELRHRFIDDTENTEQTRTYH